MINCIPVYTSKSTQNGNYEYWSVNADCNILNVESPKYKPCDITKYATEANAIINNLNNKVNNKLYDDSSYYIVTDIPEPFLANRNPRDFRAFIRFLCEKLADADWIANICTRFDRMLIQIIKYNNDDPSVVSRLLYTFENAGDSLCMYKLKYDIFTTFDYYKSKDILKACQLSTVCIDNINETTNYISLHVLIDKYNRSMEG